MVKYDEEMLQEINDNVDLLEYIKKSIDLKPKGKDYFGRCPLHSEQTPSFSVTPGKNKFYCFGCGSGGGIIQFLIAHEKLSYDEAVQKASNLAKIDLKTMCQSQTVKLNRKIKQIKSGNDGGADHVILARSEFEKYRKGRVDLWLDEGIRQEEIDLFEIRLDDRSNKIVYPVYDMSGNLINIKARTLHKDFKKLGICKYINYYPVGTVDYFQGANITLPYIKETGELKIFESLKSVMKLFGNEVKDSASAEKHTLTPEQIKWIIGCDYIKNVVFCYDSDVSYQEKEVKKNINMLKKFLNVYVIEDNDNLLGGKEAKNSPIDLGIDIWNRLYENKRKIK